jgi:hypothetical protein
MNTFQRQNWYALISPTSFNTIYNIFIKGNVLDKGYYPRATTGKQTTVIIFLEIEDWKRSHYTTDTAIIYLRYAHLALNSLIIYLDIANNLSPRGYAEPAVEVEIFRMSKGHWRIRISLNYWSLAVKLAHQHTSRSTSGCLISMLISSWAKASVLKQLSCTGKAGMFSKNLLEILFEEGLICPR